MTLRYLLARTKQNKGLTTACAAAVALIAVIFIIAAVMPALIESALTSYNRQFSGDSDLTVTLSEISADRFFNLYDLRDDEELAANTEYINGYFKSIVRFDGFDGYFTLFAANYEELNGYNPVKAANKPAVLRNDEIIISESFASSRGIKKNDRLTLILGGRSATFDVVCIAENSGLFYSGETVLIASSALNRLSPFGSGIVTHCFIKASEGKLNAVRQVLSEKFPRLKFADSADTAEIEIWTRKLAMTLLFLAVLAVVFSVLSFSVLLRLTFARDRNNFDLMKNLGMTKGGVTAITMLTGLLICVIGLAAAVPVAELAFLGLRSASVLLAGASAGIGSYAIGLSAAFAVIMFSAALCGRTRKEKKFKKPTRRSVIIFALSAAAVLAVVFLKDISPVIAAVFAALSVVGFIAALPGTAAHANKALYKHKPSMSTLGLSALSQKKDFRRFVSFFTAAALIITVFITATISTNQKINQTYPFDIMVSGIRTPDETLYNRVSAANGAEDTVKGTVLFLEPATTEKRELIFNILGLEERGFGFFKADYALTQQYGGYGAVIGKMVARQNALTYGDWIEVSFGKETIRFFVAGIMTSDLMHEDFMLVDFAAFSAPARPYSDLLVKSSGDTAQTLLAVTAAAGAYATVAEIQVLANYLYGQLADFMWLTDAFSVIFILLVAMTTVFMTVIRRLKEREETKKLVPLGLSPGGDARRNLFAAAAGFLPVLFLLPLLMWLLTVFSFGVFLMLKIANELEFLLPTAVICSAASYLFIVAAEVIISRRLYVKKNL